jgi:hypothetical protein
MSSLDGRLPLKNYNQTTTKGCDICDFWDFYHSVSTEIRNSYEKGGIQVGFMNPML